MAKRSGSIYVVDGSNLATEGRVAPSLEQLREAVSALSEEQPKAKVVVVVDATFEHRVATKDRKAVKEAELSGELVSPPAGTVGRGDAFVLAIAERTGGTVVSNDSFQEFHAEHGWLFEEGRLIGGKPVPHVGWVFTARQPVRATGASTPIGATRRAAAKKATKAVAKEPAKAAVKKAAKKVVKKAAKAVAKEPAKAAAAKAVAKEPAKPSRGGSRAPVNPEADFNRFVASHPIGSKVSGEVLGYTAHGASVAVKIGSTTLQCYAPLSRLGSPAPARARDVVKKGETRRFVVEALDATRRRAELALVQR